MKKIVFLQTLFTLLIAELVYGQQDPQYTQYMYNQNIVNPAYAGAAADLSIGILGRTQWVGIDGAPDTQTLNINSKLGRGLGIGFSAIHDAIGPVEETNVYLDLSYTMQTSQKGRLAFGIKGGYTFINNLLRSKVYDNLVQDGDLLFSLNEKTNYPNIGAGVYYYTDKFYAGLAVPGLLESFHKTVSSQTNLMYTDVSDKRHWFGTIGYVFTLNDNLKLKPSAMVKAVEGSPISFDLNSSLFIKDKFEVGLSWREGDSLDALIGFQATDNIRVGYAYDHTISPLANYNKGSHEIMLLFDLYFAKKLIKSPRYF